MMKPPFDSDEKREKFEKTLHYFIKHPHSGSAWTELGYKYYYKGYFCEEIKELIFSDDALLARGVAAILHEFGCDPSWLNDLKKAYDLHDDPDVKRRLMDCIRQLS